MVGVPGVPFNGTRDARINGIRRGGRSIGFRKGYLGVREDGRRNRITPQRMKEEGELHTKAFERFQDVNGNVDRVENSGLGRLSFFFGVLYYYLLCTLYNLRYIFQAN